MVRGEGFSIDGLNKRLSRGRKNSILAAFDRKIEELTKAGQIGTSLFYQCAMQIFTLYYGDKEKGDGSAQL